MKLHFFYSVPDAMKFITEKSLTANLQQTEKTLQANQVVKINNDTIFVDELHLLD